ncbi:unnamed protein product [Phytophthora fragariaefolia]|uniref:Unnamed protein product n=1 Tax=Phytophthora fragariaefolia TaxID=1490495 RepID=A0A9W7CR50_9STRA|nr:unnamed protein product [Phytophthora fragariaefolia]
MQLLEAWATARLEALGVDGVFAPYIVGMLPSHGGDDDNLEDAKFNIHQVLMGWLAPEDEFVDELAKLADNPAQLTDAAMALAAQSPGHKRLEDDISRVLAQDEELKASAPTFVPRKFLSPVVPEFRPTGSPEARFGGFAEVQAAASPPPLAHLHSGDVYEEEEADNGADDEDSAALQSEDSFFWSVAYEFLHDTDKITCRFWLRGTCLQAEHCVFAHDFCEYYSMDDNALGQRDYDSEDEMDQNSAPLDIQAEDMFPSLQSATSGATAPTSPPLPQGTESTSVSAATTTYPSMEDAVANLTMNFARAVALQPAVSTPPLGNGTYGMNSMRRMPPPPPLHRPLYHKAGSSEGIGTKWVSTGQSVATQYLELREQARAAVVYLVFHLSCACVYSGNKALAKGLSKQGHEFNAKMKSFHFLAASEIFESRNPPNQLYMDRMMDLHGLHVAEAVEFLTQMLPKLADEGVDSIYLVTGSGHHSKGPDGNARLLPAVERFLAGEGYQYTPVADGAGFVGMLLVDLQW